MARRKKHSITWTILYAVDDPQDEDGFYTASWFSYGRSADEAKENFMSERRFLHENCGEIDPARYHIIGVREGFSC